MSVQRILTDFGKSTNLVVISSNLVVDPLAGVVADEHLFFCDVCERGVDGARPINGVSVCFGCCPLEQQRILKS